MWPHPGAPAAPDLWDQLLGYWQDLRDQLFMLDGGAVLLACGATCALVMLAIALTEEEDP